MRASTLRPSLLDPAFHPLRQLASALQREARNTGAGLVLDVGCGARPYRALFPGPYVGLDPVGFHGDPDGVATGEHLPVRTSSVDVVLSTQILEHVEDPAEVLVEARRVLAAGGTLLLSTHGVWVHHPDPNDYWRWTEQGVRALVERHGFIVESVHYQAGLFLTALLLGTYPLGAAAASANPLLRWIGRLAVGSVNLIGYALEPLERVLPRHYASIGYLVVARAAP